MSATPLLTVEEYLRCAPQNCVSELVRGRIETSPYPFSAHGYWCAEIAAALGAFVDAHRLGRVVTNSGLQTEYNPDTLRGFDAAFHSYQRVPPGPLPVGYWPAPELIVEVRESREAWSRLDQKISAYLEAGALVVAIIDPEPQTIHVYNGDTPGEVLRGEQLLTFPDVLPGFSLAVADFFSQ
ncbi:MAG: Uma2 family endonuclease [Planctomycetaceae bacterium]|nr:Uma2 family endonuclease [Planctomycetaceae bacterium]